MKDRKSLFVLAGNGPYNNRGCEAIARGTIKILRKFYDNPKFIMVSHFRNRKEYREQVRIESDSTITHKSLNLFKRFGFTWFKAHICNTLNIPISRLVTSSWESFLNDCEAVLSIGGDNYSLDYDLPTPLVDLDNIVLSKKKPIVIWAGSVGPFSKLPEFEKLMISHLKKLPGIFARESVTIDYLESKGIAKNVYHVADPAFLMDYIKPSKDKFNIEIPKESIGFNLSPLLKKYATDGDIKKWMKLSADIIENVSEKTKRPIFLIYHVTSPGSNDFEFLKELLELIRKRHSLIELIPPGLNAPEIKWIISNMSVFAGARTHSTIAAFSTCVPTLSFAYSIKAMGINKDIYGHLRYCIEPYQLSPDLVTQKILELIYKSKEIRELIAKALPKMNDLAFDSGRYLKQIIEGF